MGFNQKQGNKNFKPKTGDKNGNPNYQPKPKPGFKQPNKQWHQPAKQQWHSPKVLGSLTDMAIIKNHIVRKVRASFAHGWCYDEITFATNSMNNIIGKILVKNRNLEDCVIDIHPTVVDGVKIIMVTPNQRGNSNFNDLKELIATIPHGEKFQLRVEEHVPRVDHRNLPPRTICILNAVYHTSTIAIKSVFEQHVWSNKFDKINLVIDTEFNDPKSPIQAHVPSSEAAKEKYKSELKMAWNNISIC